MKELAVVGGKITKKIQNNQYINGVAKKRFFNLVIVGRNVKKSIITGNFFFALSWAR